eukprot:m.46498 g.46498  ORF g.46498 m.46498 type:complete len:424 (+) comp7271_c0_seq1:516-1787(+)
MLQFVNDAITFGITMKIYFPNPYQQWSTNYLHCVIYLLQHLGLAFVVDIFDFPNSIPTDLIRKANITNLMLVVNKLDTLSLGLREGDVYRRLRGTARRVLKHECGLSTSHPIHVVSAKTNQGVQAFFSEVFEYCQKKNTQAYFFGYTNVGKSSLLNAITLKDDQATVCPSPGTTQDSLKFLLDRKRGKMVAHASNAYNFEDEYLLAETHGEVMLIDTPGALYSGHIASLLNTVELKLLQPTKKITPRTYSLKEDQALMIGGLAWIQIDDVRRAPYVTVLASPHITPHITNSSRAQELSVMKRGSGVFQPPCGEDRMMELPSMMKHEVVEVGRGWKTSAIEVVVTGVCVFSITSESDMQIKFSIFAPEGVEVCARVPLEPNVVEQRGKRIGTSRAFEPSRKKKNAHETFTSKKKMNTALHPMKR